MRLAEEAEDLAEVVDEAGDDEPARLIGGANGLGRLHRVLDLGEIDVRIAVVNECIEEVERLPYGQRLALQPQVLALLLEDEGEGLVRMVERVELLDPRPGMRVVPELVNRASAGADYRSRVSA